VPLAVARQFSLSLRLRWPPQVGPIELYWEPGGGLSLMLVGASGCTGTGGLVYRHARPNLKGPREPQRLTAPQKARRNFARHMGPRPNAQHSPFNVFLNGLLLSGW
jgi:hypothetical protein